MYIYIYTSMIVYIYIYIFFFFQLIICHICYSGIYDGNIWRIMSLSNWLGPPIVSSKPLIG